MASSRSIASTSTSLSSETAHYLKWKPFRSFLKKNSRGNRHQSSSRIQSNRSDLSEEENHVGSNDNPTPSRCRKSTRSMSSRSQHSDITFTPDPLGSSSHESFNDDISFVPKIQDGVFDETTVYDYVWEYHRAFAKALEIENPIDDPEWHTFWHDHHTHNYLFIRPSGNPLDLHGLMDQLSKGEIKNYSEKVIVVDSIKVIQECAIIVFRSETRYLYKDEPIDDLRTNMMVLVWQDGRPKVTSLQRSQGKPLGPLNPSSSHTVSTDSHSSS